MPEGSQPAGQPKPRPVHGQESGRIPDCPVGARCAAPWEHTPAPRSSWPPGGASGEAVHACLHHTRTHTHTAHSHTHNARTHSACTHAHTHMAHAHGACTHNTHGTRTHKHACTNTRAHMHTHTYTHAHAHRQQPQSTSRAWLRPPPRGAGVEGDGEPGTGGAGGQARPAVDGPLKLPG